MTFLQKLRPALLAAIVLVLAFDAAFLWQHVGGAYDSEFGGHPDEAAHYVTGLMVRDYVAARFPSAPMTYANDYYSHYPKIGLGIWPPVFYGTQAAWTLVFGVSRQSVLLLMCILASAAATVVYTALRKDYGGFIAGLGALVFVSLPLTREYYGMIMAETLSTIFMLGATLSFGSYLDRERPRDAILFGLLAALAIMTKGTGVALVLMVVLAIVFTRRWNILSRPALWVGAIITAILAGPWTWHFRTEGKGGWEQPLPSLSWSRAAVPFYLTKFGLGLGILLLIFFGIGVFVRLLKAREIQPPATEGETENTPIASNRWACLGALIVAIIVFQSIVPAGKETRHLLPAIAAGVPFAMAGFAWCLRKVLTTFRLSTEWSPFPLRQAGAAFPLLVAAAIVITASIFPIDSHRNSGFAQLAGDILREAKPTDAMLISSDAIGEGMFIAEVAMRDPHRPTYTVKRASKELAKSEWSGRGYKQTYSTDDELLAFLTSGKVRYLIADDTMPDAKREPHHDTLKRVLDVDSGHFWQLGTSEIWRDGEAQSPAARAFRIEKGNPVNSPEGQTK